MLYEDGKLVTYPAASKLRKKANKPINEISKIYRPHITEMNAKGHEARKILNIESFLKMEDYLTNLWEGRGVIWDDIKMKK
jgi:hypothetical protein